MKKFLVCFLMIILGSGVIAQVYVSTIPEQKRVILEEFTSTGCGLCPGGHTKANELLSLYPGNLFVIAYHPSFPNPPSDPFRNDFANAFYSCPFIALNSLFFPSAMIARRVWGGIERELPVYSWANDVSIIRGEPSPLNVGFSSAYNWDNNMLSVTIEVYFTSNVTKPLTIYTVLTEDGIPAYQAPGYNNYIHNHIFRAAIPQPNPLQWGEVLAGPTSAGSLKTIEYTFDNSLSYFNMTKCNVIVFVRNASNEEIITGNGAKVGYSTSVNEPGYSGNPDTLDLFPNPVTDNTNLRFNVSSSNKVSYSITNIFGQETGECDLGILSPGVHNVTLNTAYLKKGLYFVNLKMGNYSHTVKLIKTNSNDISN